MRPIPPRPRRLNVNVELDARKTARVLALVVAGLTAVHVFGQFSVLYLGDPHLFGFVPLFNLSEEWNVPALYSSAALLYCSALLALIASARRTSLEGDAHQWRGLALIFCFLAVDEAFLIHERLMPLLRSEVKVSGLLYNAWIIPYGILVGLFVTAYAGFIRRLPAATRRLFLLAGAMYVTGAVGFEAVEGLYIWRAGGRLFAALETCEEFLEMAGVVVFIYALMSYLGREIKHTDLRVSFCPGAPPPSGQPGLFNLDGEGGGARPALISNLKPGHYPAGD